MPQFKLGFKPLYLAAIYAFLYLPIFVLIFFSFNNATYSLVWHGFSLKWYHVLLSDRDLWIAALHSVILGVSASVLATVLGTLAAISLYRYQFFGKNLLHGLVFVLVVMPDLVLGISLLLLFSYLHINLGFTSLLLAHATFCLPFVIITVYTRMTGIDINIFEAAKDLGASEAAILRKITIPLLFPALIASWLLSFTLSFDDVMISYFVAGPSFEILPLKIFSMARIGIKPELNALCSITFCVTIVLVIIAQRYLRKGTK